MNNNWSFCFIIVSCCMNLANEIKDSFTTLRFSPLRPFFQLENLDESWTGTLKIHN